MTRSVRIDLELTANEIWRLCLGRLAKEKHHHYRSLGQCVHRRSSNGLCHSAYTQLPPKALPKFGKHLFDIVAPIAAHLPVGPKRARFSLIDWTKERVKSHPDLST